MKAYIVNVLFQGLQPIVSRRVILPANATFNRLHETIQHVTNFQSRLEPYHCFAFKVDELFITNNEEILSEYKGKLFGGNTVRAANRIKVDSYLEQHRKLVYTYDFGDDWRLDIELQEIVEDYYFGFPTLLAAEGTAPPEDVGGAHGYMDFLEIYHNPEHPEHQYKKNWAVSARYIPTNIEEINESLKNVKYQKTQWQHIHHDHYYILSDKYRTSSKPKPEPKAQSNKKKNEIIPYALAFANLYGYIEYTDFVRIFNEQNTTVLTIEQLTHTMQNPSLKKLLFDNGIIVKKDALLHEVLELKNLTAFKQEISTKPFYIPEKGELLKYTNESYYEKTVQQTTLAKMIAKDFYGGSTLMVQTEIDELIGYLQVVHSNFQQIIQQFIGQYPLKSVEQLNHYIQAVTHIGNTTRIWENRGHTPNELFQYEKTFLNPLPATPFSPVKAARNDPCPCESGKKYKKCCGKA